MDINGNELISIPNDDMNCFGCSPHNRSGLRMNFSANDDAVFSWLTLEKQHVGFEDIVHGGITVTMLDEVTEWTVMYFLKKMAVTKSITSDFLRAIKIDQQLRLEGRIIEMKSERESVVEGRLYDSEEILCAKAISTMALFDDDGIKRFGTCDDHFINNIKNIFEAGRV
ncbi:MAG: PaaI family thioesterase [Chloroflexota bacterium]|nr:PaaI family thioesterase [Chloroflexota bacterium]